MRTAFQLTFVAILLSCTILHAQEKQSPVFPQGTWFTENRGQVAGLSGERVDHVLYSISQPGLNIYLTGAGLSYMFVRQDKEDGEKEGEEKEVNYEYARFDLDLEGAVISKAQIAAQEPTAHTFNYYLGGTQCRESGLHGYSRLVVGNVYPGIDWVLYAAHGGLSLKYDFLVHPGADPSMIRLLYRGKEPLVLKDGQTLQLRTSLGGLNDHIPLAYAGSKTEKVDVSYRKVSDMRVGGAGKGWYETTLGFHVADYDKEKTLVIDPAQLLWGTYFSGANGFARGHILEVDHKGNLLLSGEMSYAPFPLVNPGNNAYFLGSATSYSETIIAKFDTACALTWCTFFGGSQPDEFTAMRILANNDVLVCGSTYSTDMITADPGGGAYYQPISNELNGKNGLIARFSQTGVLTWSTYFGSGTAIDEELLDLDVDPAGNIYVAGYANYLSNLPLLGPAGAYQQASSDNDGIILRFSPAGVLNWFTYFGGSVKERITNIGVKPDGRIVVCGYTLLSTDLPVATPHPGAFYQPAHAGGQDGFLAQFTPALTLEWCTYMGGSGLDAVNNMKIGHDGGIVLTGKTQSANFPAYDPGGGAFYSTTGDVVLAHFTDSLVLDWCTRIDLVGNIPDEMGLAIGSCDEIYLGGYCSPGSAAPALDPGSGAYFFGTQPGGYHDLYIGVFSRTHQLLWGTFFGGSKTDDGIHFALDADGNLFATGDGGGFLYNSTTVSTFVANCLLNPGGGAYYQALPGQFLCNPYIVKFSPLLPVMTGAATVTHPVCDEFNNGTIALTVSGEQGGGYTVSWQPGNFTDTALAGLSPGIYFYTITDSLGCVATGAVTLLQSQLYDISILASDAYICAGDTVTLTASGAPAVTWSPPVGTGNVVTVTPTVHTTYTATFIDSTNCPNSDSLTIVVTPRPVAMVTGDDSVCAGALFYLTPSGGYYFDYPNFPTSVYSIPMPFSLTADTVILVAASNAPGCTDTVGFFVDVFNAPVPVIFAPDTVCDSTSISVSTVNAGTILWNTGATTSSITVTQTGTYSVTVTDAAGCSGQASVFVAVVSCTGLPEFSAEEFSAWPNPASDHILLQLPGPNVWQVEAIDSRGRRVAGVQLSGPQAQLDCSGWSEGVYTIRFIRDGFTHELQLVKAAKN